MPSKKKCPNVKLVVEVMPDCFDGQSNHTSRGDSSNSPLTLFSGLQLAFKALKETPCQMTQTGRNLS